MQHSNIAREEGTLDDFNIIRNTVRDIHRLVRQIEETESSAPILRNPFANHPELRRSRTRHQPSSRPHQPTVHPSSPRSSLYNPDQAKLRAAYDADLTNARLRDFRGDQSKEQGLKEEFRRSIADWVAHDPIAASAFKTHLKWTMIAARTQVRILGIASWFEGISHDVRKVIFELLKYYHAEAGFRAELHGAEVRSGASLPVMRYEYIELRQAVDSSELCFSVGEDMASVGLSNNGSIDLSGTNRHSLLRIYAGLQTRKALLHAGHPKRAKNLPTADSKDSVDSKVLLWCRKANIRLLDLGIMSASWSDDDRALCGHVLEALRPVCDNETYKAIDGMQEKVTSYITRAAFIAEVEASFRDNASKSELAEGTANAESAREEADGDEERIQSHVQTDDFDVEMQDASDLIAREDDNESVSPEQREQLQQWLHEEESKFLKFEQKFGPVLGCEWRKWAIERLSEGQSESRARWNRQVVP